MSTSRCSPDPSRECSSMFLTIESARLPCCMTLSRLSRRVFVSSPISVRVFSSTFTLSSVSRSSSISSAETPEKLLTKLRGFLISLVVGTLLFGLEQPHVLDSDRCLIRERSDQLDLLVSEWQHFRAR